MHENSRHAPLFKRARMLARTCSMRSSVGSPNLSEANSYLHRNRYVKQAVTMLLPIIVANSSPHGRRGRCAGALHRRRSAKGAVHAMRVVIIGERVQFSRQVDRIPEE